MLELGWPAWVTTAVVVVALIALVRDWASPALVLLGALVVLLIGGVAEAEALLVGFANPAMLTVGALYVLAGAVRKTGALSFLRHVMMPRSARIGPALIRVMLPASVMSSVLNNTPIVAFLTPLVQRWGRRRGIPASKLLIPLSYATIVGGMGTLIGTSTNLVVSNLLEAEGERGFAMFELVWVAVPAALVCLVWFLLVGHRLLPNNDLPDEPQPLGRRAWQFDLRVNDDSPLIGQSIERAGLRHLEDAFLAHIRRRGELIGPVAPTLTLEAGDSLTFFGESQRMDRLLREGGLGRVIELHDDEADDESVLPLYEAVVSPESTLVGTSLKEADFRDRFQAVVLGIHRAGRRLSGAIGKSTIEAGDLLLIEAGPRFAAHWGQSREFYLVAPIERERALESDKAPWVLTILAGMLLAVTSGAMPMVSAAFAAALATIVTRCLAPHEARQSVDAPVLVVIACGFGIGRAIQDTGLAAWLAGDLQAVAAGLGTIGILALLYLCTNLLTEILTNSVAAVLIFPVGMEIAAVVGLDPRAVAVIVAIAASASFATPIGYQTNLMVMGPGGYRFSDYLRVGLPLNLMVMLLALAIVPRLWM